jgi:TetR/AcrR family transcriptional regulator
MNDKKKNRKQDILQNLAFMLENELSDRITTAKLAKQVGVSEAALYRHFPSKARMYESLLDFSEESIFGLIKKIDAEP